MSKPQHPQADPAPRDSLVKSTFISQFAEFNPPSEEAFARAWQEATFVFDTNTLLNLYRYPKQASDDFLGILELLGERVWIPHQVGHEFHRHRRTVMNEQAVAFEGTRRALDQIRPWIEDALTKVTTRHYLIDPDPFLEKISTAIREFTAILKTSEENHRAFHAQDKILQTLARVFDGRVGDHDKDLLKNIEKEGQVRFDHRVPPGYMDADKAKKPESKKNPPTTVIRGERFQRQFADLLLWEQIIAHAEKTGSKSLIFVTDDVKEDWMWQVSNKTVGPRPELIEEIRRRAQVEFFHIYPSGQFTKHARQHIKAPVAMDTPETISDIASTTRDVSERMSQASRVRDFTSATQERMIRASEMESKAPALPDPMSICDWITRPAGGAAEGFVLVFVMRGGLLQAVREVTSRTLQRLRSYSTPSEYTLARITFIIVGEKPSRSEAYSELSNGDIPLEAAGIPLRYVIGNIPRGTYLHIRSLDRRAHRRGY